MYLLVHLWDQPQAKPYSHCGGWDRMAIDWSEYLAGVEFWLDCHCLSLGYKTRTRRNTKLLPIINVTCFSHSYNKTNKKKKVLYEVTLGFGDMKPGMKRNVTMHFAMVSNDFESWVVVRLGWLSKTAWAASVHLTHSWIVRKKCWIYTFLNRISAKVNVTKRGRRFLVVVR